MIDKDDDLQPKSSFLKKYFRPWFPILQLPLQELFLDLSLFLSQSAPPVFI